MDPLVTSSLISAGTNILSGGMFDRNEEENRESSKLERAIDRYEQRLYATHGIRWRVADARAAGVHPLVAMGVQPTPYTPVATGVGPETGSAKADGIRAAGAAIAESIARSGREKAETRLANAQADLVEQQAKDSLLKRMQQQQTNDVDAPEFHRVQDPQYTPRLNVIGVPITTGPTSDAQSYEDRYGELGGSLMGLTNIPVDLFYSIKKAAEEVAPKVRRYFSD